MVALLAVFKAGILHNREGTCDERKHRLWKDFDETFPTAHNSAVATRPSQRKQAFKNCLTPRGVLKGNYSMVSHPCPFCSRKRHPF